jgi:hypothetical protein
MNDSTIDDHAEAANSEPEAIDPRSRSIAEKRAIGLTHGQIADLHNVSTKTVQRTLETPVIKELVRTLQSEMYAQSTAQLLSLMRDAVTVLHRLMDSESDSVAIRAASKVIDTAGPLIAHRALEQRFEEIVGSIEARLEDL